MRDESAGDLLKEIYRLRAKPYSYLKENNKNKTVKGTKKCVIKKKLNFKIIKTV